MLISCDSAGTEQDIFQAEPSIALGPLLAEAGIPAVIAMQGRISTKTATHFLKVFVEELQRTGIIDVAAATARDSVYDNTDAWMPVLFMRSNDGILWRRSQPVTERQAFDKWKSLIQHIKAGTCVPIIGPGLLEPLIGSTSEIAADLVERHSLELESPARTSLPQVTQLLQLRMDRTSMRREISDLLYEKLSQHNGGVVPDDPDTTPLHECLRAVNRKRNGFDPYQALANLPCPLFVNATADPLLEYALHDLGRDPHTVICPWSNDLDWANGAFPFAGSIRPTLHNPYVADPLQVATDQYFVPSKQSPVVYHPFGIFQLLSSLVLTEDDYFQYLVGNTKNQSKMPPAVRYGLTSSALLFLGFQLDDWGFRVLLREILQLENNGLPNRFTHVAVQIDPATPSGTIQQRIEYLEEQFRAYHITVYWGSTTDFIRKLHDEFIHVTQVHLKNRAVGSQAVTQPSGITASHNRLC